MKILSTADIVARIIDQFPDIPPWQINKIARMGMQALHYRLVEDDDVMIKAPRLNTYALFYRHCSLQAHPDRVRGRLPHLLRYRYFRKKRAAPPPTPTPKGGERMKINLTPPPRGGAGGGLL